MKKVKFLPVICFILLVATCIILFSACDLKSLIKPEESSAPEVTASPELTPNADYADKSLKVTVIDSGYDIFTPTEGTNWGYRYGPAILLNQDGSIDAWFASPGTKSGDEMDWFTYKHSDDGGSTWTEEKVVLYPTPGSLDQLSVCDPAVFYYQGYYYIGYTSTIDNTNGGLCNSTFLARSENPDGPFEKWNGNGWGGDPWPILYYTGPGTGWGEGEPSFVILNDTIYVYITSDTDNTDGNRIKSTKVYTADITKEDWPLNLQYRGVAINRWGATADGYDYTNADSVDVAYVEKYNKFLAVGTNRRFENNSCIIYYESNDGINFTTVSEINTNIICGCHNAGIMKDGNGHIKEGDPMMIGYAYAGNNNSTWGYWATRFAPIEISVTDEPDISEKNIPNLKQAFIPKKVAEEKWPVALTSTPHHIRRNVDKPNMPLSLFWYDTDYKVTAIRKAEEVTFSDYDESIISIDGLKITPLKIGDTWVTVKYHDAIQKFKVSILEKGIAPKDWDVKMVEFKATVNNYTISISQQEAVQLRSLAIMENGNLCELYNTTNSPLPKEKVTFSVEDSSVCTIRSGDCMIIPKTVGETMVSVKCGNFTYETKVTVTE